MKKKHIITCKVRSCVHNAQGGCSLQQIAVAPCNSKHSGNAEDESMCADYEGTLS